MDIKKETIEKLMAAGECRWGGWVKYVIGAIVGALVAAGVLTVTGCGVSAGVSLSSEQGVLSVSRDGESGAVVVSVVPPVVVQQKGGK